MMFKSHNRGKLLLFLFIFMYAFLIFTTDATHAQQSNDDWQVLLRPGNSTTIYIIGMEGIEGEIILPDIAEGKEIALSSNRRYVAFEEKDASLDRSSIIIVDLDSEDCCQKIGDADIQFGYEEPTILKITFSPDNTQLIYRSYVEPDPCNEWCTAEPQYTIVDLETYTTYLSDEDVFTSWLRVSDPGDTHIYALPGSSPAPYRMFSGSVWLGDRHIQRSISVTTDGLYDAGSTLANGEHVVYGFYTDEYTDRHGNVDSNIVPVIYYQNDETETRQIIYSDPDQWYRDIHGSIAQPPYGALTLWVANGTYILTYDVKEIDFQMVGQPILLDRNGIKIELDLPEYEYAVVGTPDGWVSISPHGSTAKIFHYRFNDVVLEKEMIYEGDIFLSSYQLFNVPLLGDPNADPQPLPTVPSPEVRFIG